MANAFDSLSISRVANTQTPRAHELDAIDAASGKPDGLIDLHELDSIACDAPPLGLSGEGVRALRTSFANSLDPQAVSGLKPNGCAPQTALPTSFGVNESNGTAWKTLALVGHALPTLQVLDDSGKQIAEITRSYESKGARDVFQNVFGATLTLREGTGNKDKASVLAEAKPRLIDTTNIGNNFRNIIDVYDSTGYRIGAIRQTWESVGGSILQNMAVGKSISTSYEILDASDNVVARSDKIDFFNTDMNVNINQIQVADLNRSWGHSLWRDKWHIVANPEGQVDRRILAFMASYKTMADIQVTQKNLAQVYVTVGQIVADILKSR